MSLLFDEYRANWAIRYIREAEADLSMAEKTPIPAISVSFALMAMRKSQTAVYYSLGDPEYLVPLVEKNLPNSDVKDTLMRMLVQIELLIQRDSGMAETLSKSFAIEEARHLIGVSSEVVKIMANEASQTGKWNSDSFR